MNLYNIEELLVKQNPQWVSNKMETIGYRRDILKGLNLAIWQAQKARPCEAKPIAEIKEKIAS